MQTSTYEFLRLLVGFVLVFVLPWVIWFVCSRRGKDVPSHASCMGACGITPLVGAGVIIYGRILLKGTFGPFGASAASLLTQTAAVYIVWVVITFGIWLAWTRRWSLRHWEILFFYLLMVLCAFLYTHLGYLAARSFRDAM